ncbi:sugar nucleotide-binding protein [Candidatus Pelagibacter sp. HIMB1509]|uniref:sugar nucleotide-binding protein n=1 Tax=Candidatus Pelagibacter sp. HIMB1509 TaxID=3413339 RepID=UPI003F82AB43
MYIKKCLIGYSGTIGSALTKQTKFFHKFNSKNISNIKNNKYDLVICCAARGSMIKANKNAKEDLQNIKKLLHDIKNIKAKNFFLISTIQVFKNINNKNYETSNKYNNKIPYGKNRLYLEKVCKKKFDNFFVIRLPSIFDKHIKKNFLYDLKNPVPNFYDKKKFKKLLNNTKKNYLTKLINKAYSKKDIFYILNKKKLNNYELNILKKHLSNLNLHAASLTNKNSLFQYYFLGNLWKDINLMLKNNVKVLNASCYPLKANFIHKLFTGRPMKNNQSKIYNAQMRSVHANLWGDKRKDFLYKKEEIVSNIKKIFKL